MAECENIRAYKGTSNSTVRTYCLPDLLTTASTQLDEFFRALAETDGTGKYLADLIESWQPIVYMSFAAAAITVLYIFLLQWVTMCLLYVSIFLVFAGLVATGGWSYWMSTQYPPDSEWQQYALVGAGLCITLAVCYLVCVCCCWSNIALGSAILKVAASFLSKNLRMIFLPILSSLIIVMFMCWWLTCAAWIYTIGDVAP